MMMKKPVPRKSAILDAIIKKEAAKNKAVKALEADIRKLYSDYNKRVVKFLNSKQFMSATETMNLQATTKALSELATILVDSGYESTIANFQDQFEDLTASALEYFKVYGLKPSLAGVSVEDLQVYAKFAESEFAQRINQDLVAPIRSALLQSNLGNVTRESVVQTVLAYSNISNTYRAEVLVDDAFAQYQRAVIVQKADNLEMEIYVYLGPSDAKTSDQCEAMLNVNKHGVPGMLYRDEITADLHDDLTRDPLVGGGHPNCRHQWSPVTEDYAVSLGFEPRDQKQEEEAA